ncbi:MAG: exodeoxyribonuclease III [Myxococcota bacterium]|nr:exodeoxyribonuclease III [Myxococcota bacterium]
MKLISWNVNGIRACHRKGAFLSLIEREKPDVLCVQETKAWPEQLDADLLFEHGYDVVWAKAEKKGYSGVATFCRAAPHASVIGMGIPEFDREGRVVQSKWDGLTLINAYFPNGQRDHARLPYKTEFYRSMLTLAETERAQGQEVIICGDWNTAHHEIDIRNWKTNRKTSGFTDFERALITEFCDAGYVDVFRRLNPDLADRYTWWSNRVGVRERNIGWRIDYHFVSEGLWPRVSTAAIHDQVMGSDHCPIELLLA